MRSHDPCQLDPDQRLQAPARLFARAILRLTAMRPSIHGPRQEPRLQPSRIVRNISAAREAARKAESLENAVFDLKAVNPNRKVKVDTRTPKELLDLIETKGF
jgi:hypothetical protein